MAQASSFIRRSPNVFRACDDLESALISVEIQNETPPDEEFDINDLVFNKQNSRSEVIFKDNCCTAQNFKACDESRKDVVSSEKVLAEIPRALKCSSEQNLFSSDRYFPQCNNLESDRQLNVVMSNDSDRMPPIASINLENSGRDFMLAKSKVHSDAKYVSTSDCDENFCVTENGVLTLDSLLFQGGEVQSNSCFTGGKLFEDSLYENDSADFDCLNDLLEANLSDKPQITSKQASPTTADKYCLSALSACLKSNGTSDDSCVNDFLSECFSQGDEHDSGESDSTEYSKKSSNVDSGYGSYCGSSDFYTSDYSNCSSVLQTSEKPNDSHNLKNAFQNLITNSSGNEPVSLIALAGNHFAGTHHEAAVVNDLVSDKNLTDVFCDLNQGEWNKTEIQKFNLLSDSLSNCYSDSENNKCLETAKETRNDAIHLFSSLTENESAPDSDLNHLLQAHDQKLETKASLASLAQNHFTSKLECDKELDSSIDSVSSFLLSASDCNKSTSDSDLNYLLQQCVHNKINAVENESLSLLAKVNKLESKEHPDPVNSSLSPFLNSKNNSSKSSINVIENTCLEKHKSKTCVENEPAVESSLLDIFKSVGENCHSNVCVDKVEEIQGKVESSKTAAEFISDVDLNSCVKYEPNMQCDLSKLPFIRLPSCKDKGLNLQNSDFICHSISEIGASCLCSEQLKINAAKQSLFAKALSCRPKSNKLSQKKVLKIKKILLEKYYPQQLWHDSCEEHALINEKTIFQSEGIMSGDRYLISASGVQELPQCD